MDAGDFFTAAALFEAGAVFFEDAAAFLAAAPPAGVAFLDGAAAFFAAGAAFFDIDVGAAFFTDTAFFWAERLSAATGFGDVLFPDADFLAVGERDPGTLFAGVPLLAGVIVSSLTT
ncbi:MAG TPA: hypothetical protein VIX84_06220 [Acidimicrobiales bacterium]